MGKVVPQLSWKLLLLGAGLSAFSALSTGGLVYLSSGLASAKTAWAINFLVVLVLSFASAFLKLMQRRSARYYYLGAIFFGAHLATFLYFFLTPVLFMIPIRSLWGVIVILVGLLSFLVNARMAWLQFSRAWQEVDVNSILMAEGVRGISLRKFAKVPDMEGATSTFNFEPQWLSKGLSVAALGGMILGFGLRKAYPEVSMVAIGLGAVYVAGYFAQLFVILFRKVCIVSKLEKICGCPLVAMDCSD